MRLLVVIVVAMLACKSDQMREDFRPSVVDECTGRCAVEVASACIRSDQPQRLLLHVAITAHYTKGAEARDTKTLWQINCDLSDNQCNGVTVDLDKIERGQPLGVFGIGQVEGAEIASAVGSVYVIKWGVYRTFTVDLDRNVVTFVESGEGMRGPIEGRGEASCIAKPGGE